MIKMERNIQKSSLLTRIETYCQKVGEGSQHLTEKENKKQEKEANLIYR